ncbi:rod shape-determining protein MreC [bacterium]|nr:rod shape-determining protein MreC [bacterium]MCK4596891.1 rod shape-determining protein MreC [bacterium]
MSRLTFWTERSRRLIVLSCAVIISTVLLSMGHSQKAFVVRALTISILAPVQKGISLASQFWDVYFQNRSLRQLNTELSLENQMLREAQLENLRLRQLLSFRERQKLTSILLAEVIAREPARQMNSILIGSGSHLGVKQNMSVVTSQGLVGRVVEVYPSTAIVQVLLDRNCPVSAMVQRSRVSGILVYEGGASFRLKNVPWRMDVVAGDMVISSGLGGVFPKGLQLGRVGQVFSNERELFKEIVVQPSVDFNSLEEVFVILNTPQDTEEGEK